MRFSDGLKGRVQAAAIHFGACLLIALMIAALVFFLWFPSEYSYLSGGTTLLLLILSVDVILGPVLTFAVFNQTKSVAHLRRDLLVIILLQLGALSYGMYTVILARPVGLVFEFDRFRVLSSAEVVHSELSRALPPFQSLPLNGPRLLAVRKTQAGEEKSDALLTAILQGVDTSQRPNFWIPYGSAERMAAWEKGRPITDLIKKYPGIEAELREKTVDDWRSIRYLPVRSRNDAVALIDRRGEVLGFLPYDGFF